MHLLLYKLGFRFFKIHHDYLSGTLFLLQIVDEDTVFQQSALYPDTSYR